MKTVTDDSDFDQKTDLKRVTKTVMRCKNHGKSHSKAIQIRCEKFRCDSENTFIVCNQPNI